MIGGPCRQQASRFAFPHAFGTPLSVVLLQLKVATRRTPARQVLWFEASRRGNIEIERCDCSAEIRPAVIQQQAHLFTKFVTAGALRAISSVQHGMNVLRTQTVSGSRSHARSRNRRASQPGWDGNVDARKTDGSRTTRVFSGNTM